MSNANKLALAIAALREPTMPLKWRKPRTVFVNSVSDLFHEDVPFDYIDQVFAVMALTPQHTYQILTKHPERMAEYMTSARRTAWSSTESVDSVVCAAANHLHAKHIKPLEDWLYLNIDELGGWPLPNVRLGTSVENQATANERIPHLLRCPAAVRFLSCEPLLGPVDLVNIVTGVTWPGKKETSKLNAFSGVASSEYRQQPYPYHQPEGIRFVDILGHGGIGWVIVGGESGHGARPMHPDWARDLAEQCQSANVPIFVKQMGSAWAKENNCVGSKGAEIKDFPEDLQRREFPRIESN